MHEHLHVHPGAGCATPGETGRGPGEEGTKVHDADDAVREPFRPTVTWRKSTASNPSGNCVELAELPGGRVAVRNSRHPTGPRLVYTRAEIAAFVHGVRSGEFDDLVT
jgi:hypothetical protein